MRVSATFKDKEVRRAFREYGRRGGKIKKLLKVVGEQGKKSTRKRLDAQKNVDGSKFAPLSAEYAKRKRKNKNRILRLTGGMRKTIAWQLTPSGKSVRIGFGSKVSVYHMSDKPRSKMPRRNPLGLDKADVATIVTASKKLLTL